MNHTFPFYIIPIPAAYTVHHNLHFSILTAVPCDLCESAIYIAQHNLHYTTLTTVPGDLYKSYCFLLCNVHPGCIAGPWWRTCQTRMPGDLFKSMSLVTWYPPYVLYLFPKNLVKFVRNFTLKFLSLPGITSMDCESSNCQWFQSIFCIW